MSKPRKFLENFIKPFVCHHNKDANKEEDLETIAAKEQKLFPYEVLAAATNNFSTKHKLGVGGFGAVYKGRLGDGREVAVKKLSVGSRQGTKEFMNEAMLLSRVQHKNVVNLYGYYAATDQSHHQEKLLVYEYVPHESLDKLLFGAEKKEELDWKKRDIKASNILLDDKWIPKISDFGMARLYPEDQTHVNTRVAGTNGYMAPEYLMHGQLSTKADVFSFGVLVLELISGQKNSTFTPGQEAQSLLEWAWRLHKRRQSLDMMDDTIRSTASPDQVAMCVHIGLLCTQADPKLRPDMRRVVVILSKKPSTLEEPTRPGFPGSRYRRVHGPRPSLFHGESSSHSMSQSTSASPSTSTLVSTSNTNMGTMSATTTISPRPPSHEKRPTQS